MITKFDKEMIQSAEVDGRYRYTDYQKLFQREIGRLKIQELKSKDQQQTASTIQVIIFTEYKFSDGRKRPLMIFGVNHKWKEWIKATLKAKTKGFGVGEIFLTKHENTEKFTMHITLNNGRAREKEAKKLFKKYPPFKGVNFSFDIEQFLDEKNDKKDFVDEMKDLKKGLLGSLGRMARLFEKIRKGVKDFEQMHDVDEQLETIPLILKNISDWLVDYNKGANNGKKIGDNKKKRHSVIMQLKQQLETKAQQLNDELNSIGGEKEKDHVYLMGLYKTIGLDIKNYSRNKDEMTTKNKLELLHSIQSDINLWQAKHESNGTKKIKDQREYINAWSEKVQFEIDLLGANSVLTEELKLFKRVQIGHKRLKENEDSEDVNVLVFRLNLISKLEKIAKELELKIQKRQTQCTSML